MNGLRKFLCFIYRFAALMNGQLCYCISRFGQEGPSNGCNVPCTNDPNNYCGSYEAMSVYATGQQGRFPNNINHSLYITFFIVYIIYLVYIEYIINCILLCKKI